MDLKHILNPAPKQPDPRPRLQIQFPPPSQPAESSSYTTPSSAFLSSKFFLSPRRLDPETASVSTNSSRKRRRTQNRKGDAEYVGGTSGQGRSRNGTAMGRSFSELDVPSDRQSSDDEGDQQVKRGVAQLSLSGTTPGSGACSGVGDCVDGR